ncbi:MAG: hypothetical protein IJ159_03880 [Prevotella sp.]|nr:hypothetical protein [Prevotella sp.]
MTTTTKKTLILALTLLTAGALVTSCDNEDNIADEPQTQQPAAGAITFTATLAPKGDDGGQTRAITTGTDGGKEVLNVAWATSEKIALYYQTASGYAKATATVQSVDATTGAATITADLAATTTDGGTVKFVYPSTLANDTGDDIDESKLMTQYGKIDGIANSISKKFDAATGTGKIHLNGGTALPTTATVTNTAGTGNVSLQSRVCICKFRLSVYTIGVNGTPVTLSSGTNDDLTISDGNGHTYTIKSTKDWPGGTAPAGATGNPGYATGDDIYVAMLPIENKPLTLSLTYTDNSVTKNLTLTTKPGTLAAGKFYRDVPVTMELENMQVTGSITQTLTVPDGMTVTMNDTSIDVSNNQPAIVLGEGSKLIVKGTNNVRATYADAIQCNGNATIDFESTTNTITAVTPANKGIQIADGKSLNITGTGSTSLSGNIGVPASASLKFDGQAASHDIYIPDATTLSASGITVGSTITIGSGEHFTLSWTTINVTSGPGIQCSGNATIILDGTNTISTTAEGYPAIQAGSSGTTLTIQGSGSVTATGGKYGAGIGSRSGSTNGCGNITISGTVTATGGQGGAGIGSGKSGICGDVTISGGNITANGGEDGAGIGSGSGVGWEGTCCGTIIISGGTVTATGGQTAAGIGSGRWSRCDNITITNGVTRVTANKGNSAPYSIGKGATGEYHTSTCGTVTIGGTVRDQEDFTGSTFTYEPTH